MKKYLIAFLIIIFVACIISIYANYDDIGEISIFNKDEISILSSYENSYLEENIVSYAKNNNITVNFTYMGDLDIVDELNDNSSSYDAVWISNSMWLYLLDNSYLLSNSKSISVSPVVVGIKNNKASELGIIGKEITNSDILKLIQENKIKYVMSSVTQTNTGATAYFGFLDALAGNPEVLTEEMLNNDKLVNDLISVFSGVERVSGDEDFLEEMFLNNDMYESVISDEASLININKELITNNKEPLYLLYPTDGVALSDSTFAFIDNKKDLEESFLKIQNYLLSGEGQKMLENSGRRTWYGGINLNADKEIFNPSWGIDTTKYLNVTKYPSKTVMTKAINLYIEKLRKPTHVVFCLDYSGSMYGKGNKQLVDAMKYILNYEEAAKDKLQFSSTDKISIIVFGNEVKAIWQTESGTDTADLITKIENKNPDGGTALYDAIESGLDILNAETNDYTKTIIAMTDGEVNIGSFSSLSKYYKSLKSDVPVYSITFGNAKIEQLSEIATLTNAKVFDGTEDLLSAFKEVRGYN